MNESTKICPVLSVVRPEPVPCLEDRCAWWHEYQWREYSRARCALESAADSLDGVNHLGMDVHVD